MRDRVPPSLTVFASSLMLAGAALAMTAPMAAAQGLIFDWDGEKKTADSGKTHVKFNGGGKPGEIVVSFADKKLYFFTAPGEADVYPVATPRDQSRWEGVTSVTQKRENPSWTPTAHMLVENPKLPRWVPGGHPMNPLGIRALYLGSSDYRIHGTDAPWTIGTPVSKGCVRMFNKDVVDLYPRVKVGTKVIVTWQKFDGKTFAINETKGITELPPGIPPATAGAAGKPTLASFVPEQGGSNRSKYRRPVEDDDNEDQASVAKPAAVQDEEKAKPVAQDEAAPKKRKLRAMSSNDAEDATTEMKPRAEIKEKSKTESIAAASPGAANEPAAAAAKPERRIRTASHTKPTAKSEPGVETGSVSSAAHKVEPAAKKADEKKSDDAASLGVAEKALAAAERAAAAAERAAAAAERAVAAVNQQQPAVVPAASTGAAADASAH